MPFDHLLDAIAVCRGEGALELLDLVVDYALKSVTGEVPHGQWRPIVVEAAQRLLSTTDFESLAQDAARAASELRSRLHRYGGAVQSEMESQARTFDEVTVLLANPQPASLVSVCSRLRRLGRPDLGRVAASRAIDQDARLGAARTTRAAAILDLGNPSEALPDLEWLEAHDPSHYSANVWSRTEQMRGQHRQAKAWAIKANERDPEGVAGMLSLAKVASVTGDNETAAWAFEQWQRHGGAVTSAHYPAFVAAKDLFAGGQHAEARRALIKLRDLGYGPARRFLLEKGASRTHSAAVDGSSPV